MKQVITKVEFNRQAATQAPIMVYISFRKRCRLANEGLVNLTGCRICAPYGT